MKHKPYTAVRLALCTLGVSHSLGIHEKNTLFVKGSLPGSLAYVKVRGLPSGAVRVTASFDAVPVASGPPVKVPDVSRNFDSAPEALAEVLRRVRPEVTA